MQKAFSWGFDGNIGRPVPDEFIEYTPGLVAGIPEDQRISKVILHVKYNICILRVLNVFRFINHERILRLTQWANVLATFIAVNVLLDDKVLTSYWHSPLFLNALAWVRPLTADITYALSAMILSLIANALCVYARISSQLYLSGPSSWRRLATPRPFMYHTVTCTPMVRQLKWLNVIIW